MQMDILIQSRIRTSSSVSHKLSCSSSSSPSSFRIFCSRKGFQQEPKQNGDDSNNNNNNNNNKSGDKFSRDWDKAWSNFKKQGRKSLTKQFNPDKYVSWNPRRSNYPISEEVDPIKRTERSNLMLWTSPRFTLAGAIVIVSLLLLYTILAPMK